MHACGTQCGGCYHTDTYSQTYSYSYSNAYSYTYTYGKAYTYSYSYSYSYTYTRTNTFPIGTTVTRSFPCIFRFSRTDKNREAYTYESPRRNTRAQE
jgi:hypothetical protein